MQIEGHTLRAEWVNLPANLARQGAFIRTECREAGSKWIGTSRSNRPCGVGGHMCRLITRTEIDSIAADRITGRAQTLKNFDCEHCRILETTWADFVWVPAGAKTSKR